MINTGLSAIRMFVLQQQWKKLEEEEELEEELEEEN